VLEGLDQIDWARLTHAYGPATDVPDQIRAVHSADPAVRQRALHDMHGNIFHQGTRFEATAYAVPFLLEVVAEDRTRADVLRLLTLIATGYDEGWLPEPFLIAESRRTAMGGDVLLASAPHPGDDGYDEETGYDEFVEALSHEDQTRLYAFIEVPAYDAVRLASSHAKLQEYAAG